MADSGDLTHPWLTSLTSTLLRQYKSLGKAGKPGPGQWTVLAAVALVKEEQVRLISFATGTKCLGGEARKNVSVIGSALNDTHAEVVARRGLLLWLVKQVEMGGGQLVEKVEGKEGCWRLKPGWKLVLLTTHPPCGDATISPLSDVEEESGEPCAKRRKVGEDFQRTGGKVAQEGEKDPGGDGKDYHRLGLLRTKPGRGPRTSSLSCSDKMLKWNILGLQGALLSHLFPEPLFFSFFVLCHKPLHKPSLSRALWERAGTSANQPELLYYFLVWDYQKKDGLQACPDTLICVASGDNSKPLTEALTGGFKQGWAKKKLNNPKAWSQLSRRWLASRVAAQIPQQFCTYASLKTSSPQYRRKEAIVGSLLDLWPSKPLEDFLINDTPDNVIGEGDTNKGLTSANQSPASLGFRSISGSVLHEASNKTSAVV